MIKGYKKSLSFVFVFGILILLNLLFVFSFESSLDDNLISRWTMDAEDGSNNSVAVDVVGENHGVIHGDVFQNISGVKGEAYEFDGSEDYIEVSSVSSFEPEGQKTISLWVYFIGDKGTLLSKYQTDTSEGGYLIKGMVATWMKSDTWNSDSEGPVYRTSSNLASSSWNNVVMVWDTDSGIQKLYINGNFVDNNTELEGTFTSNNLSLLFGASWYGPTDSVCVDEEDSNCFFEGLLDEIAIWNRSLTEDEIQELYSFYNVNCGDGLVQEPESCDGGNLSGETCSDFDFDGGGIILFKLFF